MRRHPQRHSAAELQQVRDDSTGAAVRKPEVVRIGLLGGFRLWVGPRVIQEDRWRLRKARSLIKLLALAEGHCLHREQIMETLWPGLDPRSAANNFHQILHAARRALEPSALAISGSASSTGYLLLRDEQLTLCPDSALWVDVEGFEEAAANARHAPLDPQALRAAIDLYAGELLPEDRYEVWVEEQRAELHNLYISLLFEVATLSEEHGEFGEAIEALGRVVAEEPTHEGAHVGLMRLHALLGRRREALGQYENLRRTLSKALGTGPEAATTSLQQQIWAGTFPPDDSPPVGIPPGEETPSPPAGAARRHNLPLARTSFVGRGREKIDIKRLLAMTRLLTLTGAGGCGKTRLAIEVARDLVGAYPDGVWVVELAPLTEGALVPQVVARPLGVTDRSEVPLTDTLAETLRTKQALLVLDNCEHLVEAVAHLVDILLDACPRLRILATSREGLDVAGEMKYLVGSLSVPDSKQRPTAEELARYESVRLFAERARYRSPAFVLNPQNVQVVAQICERLDGIPLAIELAAARIGLSTEQIAARLDDSLQLLTAGSRTATSRQRALRGALDWSYDLLSEPEQVLFGRLSVFAGGWTFEAAEVVGAAGGIKEEDVLDLLLRLVDKSLVVTETTEEGEVRYRMLQPIRLYALEKLEESREAEEHRHQHARYYLALAEEAKPELNRQQQGIWLDRLETEHDNLRTVLSWSLGPGDAELGLRLSGALWVFWRAGYVGEGRRWQIEDNWSLAWSLLALGSVSGYQEEYERAMEFYQEGLVLCRELGSPTMLAEYLISLGYEYLFQGDYERAATLNEEAAALLQEQGHRNSLKAALITLGWAALLQGDHERAKASYKDSLTLCQELGDKMNIAENLDGLAGAAEIQGEAERAAMLFGAAQALREEVGYQHAPREHALQEPYLADAYSRLGETLWEAAWAEGKAMTLEEAAEYALSEQEHKPPTLIPVPEQQPQPVADELTERLTPASRRWRFSSLVG